jgi:hypothetical protein
MRNRRHGTGRSYSGILKSRRTRTTTNRTTETPKPSKQSGAEQMMKSIFEAGTDRVSQDFLDLLNGESTKMTMALQNQNNWPGIMEAANELRGKLPEVERQMGVQGDIGPMEISESVSTPIPTQPAAPPEAPPYIDVGEREKIKALLLEANQYRDDHPRRRHLLIRMGKALVKKLAGFSFVVLAAAPLPQMQLQRCTYQMLDSVMTVRCDSSKVCPAGYALDTWLDYNPDGTALSSVFGYGSNAHNSCMPWHRPQNRKIIEVIP